MADDIQSWLATFEAALPDISVADLFAPDAAWRDILAFSWNLRTFEGQDAIRALVTDRAAQTSASGFASEVPAGAQEGFFRFETALGRGRGYLRLKDGRALTLLTALEELKGHEEPLGPRRATGMATPGDHRSWAERRRAEQEGFGPDNAPHVLIVGGGQGGLALAARLRMLDVPTLVVDRHSRVGDQWRRRYRSLTLHDPVWYDHLPYLPFPPHWPVYTPKDRLADWLEAYANILELNVWTDTECVSATPGVEGAPWRITVRRHGADIELQPKELVMAVGNAGFPRMPEFAGAESFAGELLHSSAYQDGEAMAGKRVVVIGANNSAHDIAADLFASGARVTMVQRSSTLVVRQQTLMQRMVEPLWSEAAAARGLSTDLADLLGASLPIRMQEAVSRDAWAAIAEADAPFYDGLRAAGFALDFGPDGTGLGMKYLRTASGYYIDVGASALIADGSIALRSGVAVERLEPDGVRLASGELLAADCIVCATGFGTMEQWVERLISPEVAARVGRCWGYGAGVAGDPGPWDGELRNMWKPTMQSGLWFHGGNLAQSRFYSRALALQLKARLENLPVRPLRF
jgi:putative flavoprotein involved in K+ transport